MHEMGLADQRLPRPHRRHERRGRGEGGRRFLDFKALLKSPVYSSFHPSGHVVERILMFAMIWLFSNRETARRTSFETDATGIRRGLFARPWLERRQKTWSHQHLLFSAVMSGENVPQWLFHAGILTSRTGLFFPVIPQSRWAP
jgi:hypothetical protein